MSVVRRRDAEEGHRKRRRKAAAAPSPAPGAVSTAPRVGGPDALGAPARAESSPRPRPGAPLWETLALRHGLAERASTTFVFRPFGKRVRIPLAALLEGAVPGWLAGVLPEAVDEEIQVPEDTPFTMKTQTVAFQLLLEAAGPPARPVREVFSGARLRMLPHAYLAAHVAGLERAATESRNLFLQAPSPVLRTLRLRKGDGEALLRAIELGFASSTSPLQRGVAQQVEAAALVLRAQPSRDWGTEGPSRLLHVFRAAHELRSSEVLQQVRLAAGAADSLQALVACVGASGGGHPVDEEALRFGVRHGLDRDCGMSVLHAAAAQGRLEVVQLALREGQPVNTLSKASQESPAMLAAARGHLEVLRCLARQKADLAFRNTSGLTALDLAARSGHASLVDFLANPLLRLSSA